MESEKSVDDDTNTTLSSATNWATLRGNLVNSITFESSFYQSPTGDLNPTAKRRPLILKPTAPDSGPCEITISFAQKHEIEQIYVKSTARVYEIYCSSDLQSDSEYLCTVRCGRAARDDDDDDDNEEALSFNSNGSQNSGNECNRSANEDEWIEVKGHDSSLALIKPEYHEATAQMSDVNPCRSIKIRLLSLQSKEVVFVDEVYVFADPVDDAVSENQTAQTENRNGSSLMAMLMPTLLQMSKTKDSTRVEDKKPIFDESASERACSSLTNDSSRAQNDGKSSSENNQIVEFRGDFRTNDRVEKGLEELCTRMGRIEDLFLRLEEKLVKPINSIEARLDRVEQQLEVLTNNRQKDSEVPSYSRFCAPNFSSICSDSNSFYRSETECPSFEELAKNIQSDDVSDNANDTTQMLPALVVAAPEFSNCDDDDNEEKTQESEIVNEISVEEVKRPLTVDDALAAALAGLVSSISIQGTNHTPSYSVKAPDFPNDEDNNSDKKYSPRGQPDIGLDETESENISEKITEEIDAQTKHYDKGNENESSSRSLDQNEEIENEELNEENTEDLFRDKTVVEDELIPIQTTDMASSVEISNDGSECKENNALSDIMALSHSVSASLDLKSSVLDVEFLSQDHHSNGLSLEALLSDVTESHPDEAICAEESEESRDTDPSYNDEHSELILVEHGGPLGPAFSSQIIVDFNYCSVQEQEALHNEDETTQLCAENIRCSHENLPQSLI